VKLILTNLWSHFGSLGQGFLQSAILNEKKALATRLSLNRQQGIDQQELLLDSLTAKQSMTLHRVSCPHNTKSFIRRDCNMSMESPKKRSDRGVEASLQEERRM